MQAGLPSNTSIYTLDAPPNPLSLAEQLYTFMIMSHINEQNIKYGNIKNDNMTIVHKKDFVKIINNITSCEKCIGKNIFK